MGPHTLLPAKAVGPAFFLDKTGTIFQDPEWRNYIIFAAVAPKAAETYLRYPWCRAELFSHYFRRGRNAMYFLEHDDVKLVDVAEGLTKALCTGFSEYGGFPPERLSWETRRIAACRVSRR